MTADFTPDASLMIAAATFIVGVVRDVMSWPSYELEVLESVDIPVVRDFAPEPHSSRHGWVARFTSFVENPFACDVNSAIWPIRPQSAASRCELSPNALPTISGRRSLESATRDRCASSSR